ncbi:MAG: beta-propeller fold lactonase family protein, partial [Clostridiaceae bacterium]|nr:beta-propeller fold lactonase family protein [Clostridiaceae bacterium]
ANHGGNGMITKTRLHSDGTYSLCREYDEANITLFPLNVDGSISSPSHIIRLTGNGPRKSQKSSHPHSIMASPDGKIFIVCDFGADRIYSFTIDRQKNILKTAYEYKVPAGSAPRYSAFHPKKPYFFVNNEVRPYVESFLYAENGTFEKVDELYVLPDNAVPDQLPLISDIRIHPTGKYLYNLSRTYNTVTVIGINETTGKMKILQLLELTGDFPKGCNISPDGSYLYIAMKKSGEVLLCRIAENGLLTLSDLRFPVQNAANITFYESGTN